MLGRGRFGAAIARAAMYNNGMHQAEPSPVVPTLCRFRWRRLAQYRLRTLLIGTTLVAVWLAWEVRRENQQRQAVKYLRDRACICEFRPRFLPGVFATRPALLTSLERDHLFLFNDVYVVTWIAAAITDEDSLQLNALNGLESFTYSNRRCPIRS